MSSGDVEIRVLGAVDVRRGGASVELPASKKTKGLLAYLVLTGRAHRRERLCTLLWDVADDPRAALRWSLSKLRAAVESDGVARIKATRETVAFTLIGLRDGKVERIPMAGQDRVLEPRRPAQDALGPARSAKVRSRRRK